MCFLIEKEIKDTENKHVITGRAELVHHTPKTWLFPSVIAICGGILLARSQCFENTLTTTIIGIGISTSILPPIVAGGFYSSLDLNKSLSSIALAILNIVLIFISYTATLFLTW